MINYNKLYHFSAKMIITILFFVVESIEQTLSIDVAATNTVTVAKYEKFEAILSLSGAVYDNPYDPQQVDIHAFFTSPSDSVWDIFGFYDNYYSRDHWKVRFAPNETGEWTYYLTVVNGDSMTQSPLYTFIAVDSELGGWMHVAKVNPHYFELDDGSSYYPIGPYYPWGVESGSNGLDLLESVSGDFFGYWNIMYDQGEIIESMNSGLGRYDQPKCGRIDNIIQWAEERDMKIMVAIWPHDLLSETVWVHQWHQNPYNTICDVTEFFNDATAWEYQKKQYRYLIARWGYSRALGIWEIVNEINGTDGWESGKAAEATNWVKKVHEYLTVSDPHRRPTTANQSGGIYWPEGYALVDVSNVHLYETGWTPQYFGNPLRSSYHTYSMIAHDFYYDFDKPGILGEAGYTNTYGNFPVPSTEYTQHFHNALWASWASGLAATPVWWAFQDRKIMSVEVINHYQYFSNIIKGFDYAHTDLSYLSVGSQDVDGFGMKSEKIGFGWLRENLGKKVENRLVYVHSLPDTTYYFHWHNTWTGNKITTTINVSGDGTLEAVIPDIDGEYPDVAFFFELAEEGEEATLLDVTTSRKNILNLPGSIADITCYIKDDAGRIVSKGEHPVTFTLGGPGQLIGDNPVTAEKSIARIVYEADENIGEATIIAFSPGLASDTVVLTISNTILIDDFESYKSSEELQYKWKIRSGTEARVSLHGDAIYDGQYSMQVKYGIGNPYPPYAGVFTHIDDDLSGINKLHFWVKPDASNRNLTIVLHESSGNRYWQYDWPMIDDQQRQFDLLLSEFYASEGTEEIDPGNIDEISFNILKGSGEYGLSSIYLDAVYFTLPSSTVGINNADYSSIPSDFELEQNFPNPFNPSTTIRFHLPKETSVEIVIFNNQGQVVEKLTDGTMPPGTHEVIWQPVAAASGIYFYRLKTKEYTSVKKCFFLK